MKRVRNYEVTYTDLDDRVRTAHIVSSYLSGAVRKFTASYHFHEILMVQDKGLVGGC